MQRRMIAEVAGGRGDGSLGRPQSHASRGAPGMGREPGPERTVSPRGLAESIV